MHDDFHFAVLEFIRESGFTALYIQRTGDYDPELGEVVQTVTTTPVEAILLDLTLQSNGFGTKLGTEIQMGDKQLYVRPPHKTRPGTPVLKIDPADDRIRIGDIEYTIVTFKEFNTTATDPALYEFYIRR